jgi:hypothetical protein
MDIRRTVIALVCIVLAVILLLMSYHSDKTQDFFYSKLFFIVALFLMVSAVLGVWLLPIGVIFK